jgi:hypothetical protein
MENCMDKQSNIERLRSICEVALIRAAENGDILSVEDLCYQVTAQVTERICNLQGCEGLQFSQEEIKKIAMEAKEEFEDTYIILKNPEEEEFGF